MKTDVRILIADDHELVRQGIRAILVREAGWRVCGEATTGRQALDMALELKPDIIILDLSLPELNGVEVTRRVRNSLPIPVLIVTAYNEEKLLGEAINAGASGYILKAAAGHTLTDAVRAILDGSEPLANSVDVLSEPTTAPHGSPERLTSREREVLQLLAEGRANKEVAAALGITIKTAETHRARIMMKLGFHSMSELVRYAVRNHIIEA